MKVINSKLAAIGLAAFVFASCSDSSSDGGQTPTSPDIATVGLAQTSAEQLAASVTNYKNAITKARASRAADATVFAGLTEMEKIPAQTGAQQIMQPTDLVNGKFYVQGKGKTFDLSGKKIQNAEIWVNGGATLVYDATQGGNKIYVENGATLEFKGTGSAIAATDKVVVDEAGQFTSANDITIDGTLFSTTSVGKVNKNEHNEITGPAQNVTINGSVYLFGYESPNKTDPKTGEKLWSFASIRAKKLTVGANARINVEDKISFTEDAEINGAVHVGKTMEVNNLTIGATGNVSSDISIKVKNALTMNGGKLAANYLNVTDNTYASDGTENKKKTATGTATATLNGNSTITVNANGVLNFNILKTDNTAGQIVLNSNDAKAYAVIKADQFEYTGSDSEVKFLSTPQNNSAAFLLQFTKNKANGTEVDFKDLAFSASYLDYDVATDGAALDDKIVAGKYHTWSLNADAVAKIQNLPKLDLVSSLNTPADGQSATSILPYNGKLYVSYHTNGNSFGGNIEVAQMIGNQLEKKQSVYQTSSPADFNHLNVIDGKLYLAGSTSGSALMAYANINGDGTIDAATGLSILPFSAGGAQKNQADFGDANCVVKKGSKIYVASTRGYEIFDPDNGYLHTYVATAGKAKFVAVNGNSLYGLNYTSAVRANENPVEGQVQIFNSEDLSSATNTISLGTIAPNNGKNAMAVESNGTVYVCQSAKGLKCYKNGTEAWSFVAPKSSSVKNNLVDKVEGYANGVAYDANYVYLACGSYGLVVLNKADGTVVAHRNIGKYSANYVAVDGNYIYVAYGQNRIQVFKLTNTVK